MRHDLAKCLFVEDYNEKFYKWMSFQWLVVNEHWIKTRWQNVKNKNMTANCLASTLLIEKGKANVLMESHFYLHTCESAPLCHGFLSELSEQPKHNSHIIAINVRLNTMVLCF